METKYEKQSNDRFTFISENMLNILKDNNVKTLGQLSRNTRTKLKDLGFEHNDISKINIELQLLGLGLKNQ